MVKAKLAGFAALLLLSGPADARPAQCETSDDGRYPCEFTFLDRQGSFEISAPGRPTIRMEVDSPGVAFGFATYERGGRAVSLPGRFRRRAECWINDETGTRVCAR